MARSTGQGMSLPIILPVLAAALIVNGCGSHAGSVPSGLSGKHAIALTPQQHEIVDQGVGEMMDRVMPGSSREMRLRGIHAFVLKPGGPVQVCGDVTPGSGSVGELRKTFPWYLELENRNGVPVARRGQVGSDKLKRAKVLFLCRDDRLQQG